MDDRELHGEIVSELAVYRAAGWSPFIRPNRGGALYYPGDDRDLVSPTNTAFLTRLTEQMPEYSLEVSPDDRARWRDGVLTEALRRYRPALTADPRRPERAEYDAYRVARILPALSDPDAEAALLGWIEAYTTRWLCGGNFQINLFLLYLVGRAVGTRADYPLGNVKRIAEFALAHQAAFGASELRTDLDAIDLALAIAMCDPGSASSRLFANGLDILNREATQGRTWKNQQLMLHVGDSLVGCSAFEACLALCNAPLGPSVLPALRGALLSHWQWLRARRPLVGPWRVSDLSARSAITEPWFNCLVIEFLVALRDRLEEAVQASLRAKYRARFVKTEFTWDDMILGEEEKVAVARAFIEPVRGRARVDRLERCTAILFGPPGTSKTTIAETIAAEIGWPFIELGVADFIQGSLDSVFSRSAEIFGDLLWLERAVVLLDEVEEVFAERVDQSRGLLQKFLTSALLPPLKQVSKTGRIILLIATNRVGEFDLAVWRPGRIDLIVPVGPPDAAQRQRLLTRRPVNLPADVASALEALLPRYVTIEEIRAIARLPRPASANPAEAAQELLKAWKLRYRDGQLGEPEMTKFRRERERYARLD